MPSEPKDPQLFELFCAAIRTGLYYVETRRSSPNGFIAPHREWPDLTWHANGMPWIINASEAPHDYADALSSWDLFGFGEKSKTNFRDDAAFVSLLVYARKHPDISERLSAEYSDDLFAARMYVLIGQALDRYIHTSGRFDFDAETLLETYLPIEQYLLTPVLNFDIVVPIVLLRFDTDWLAINDSVAFGRMPDRIHLARAPQWNYHYGSDPRVQTAATHALILMNYQIPNKRSSFWHVLGDATAYPLHVINDFFASLRIVTGYSTGYAQLLAVPRDWAAGYKADLMPMEQTAVRFYPEWFENGYWNQELPLVTESDIKNCATMFRQIRSLEKNKRFTVALRRLNSSAIRNNDEDGILDTMIAFEALLSDGNQEMTYKVAIRMAALYKLVDAKLSSTVLGEMKKAYKLRSQIVHGDSYDINQTVQRRGSIQVRLVEVALEHLRTALRLLTEHTEYLDLARLEQDLLLGEKEASSLDPVTGSGPNAK